MIPLREIYLHASYEIGDALPFVLGLAASALGFFLKGAFRKNDLNTDAITNLQVKSIADINEKIGLLNAAKDRSREKDEEQGRMISELQRSVQDSRERIIVLEHESKK